MLFPLQEFARSKKDLDHVHNDYNKAMVGKEKFENLCRELQKMNKQIKDETARYVYRSSSFKMSLFCRKEFLTRLLYEHQELETCWCLTFFKYSGIHKMIIISVLYFIIEYGFSGF